MTAGVVEPFTVAGFTGSMIVVAAYFANQKGSLAADDWRYSLANLVGAALILASLHTAWNLPTAVIEGFWAAISLWGLARRFWRGPA